MAIFLYWVCCRIGLREALWRVWMCWWVVWMDGWVVCLGWLVIKFEFNYYSLAWDDPCGSSLGFVYNILQNKWSGLLPSESIDNKYSLINLGNTIKLEKDIAYSQIQDYLFYIHEENSELKDVPKRYYEPITIKHKYSQKYLNHHKHIVDNSDGSELVLSHEPKYWTVLPSFKYQTKNTENIYFNDRVYLYEQYYNDINSRSITVF